MPAVLRRMPRTAPVVAVVALVVGLLGLAWMLSNPPGAAPDEHSHYVRMVGLSQGDLVGEDLPADFEITASVTDPVQLERLRVESGLYRIPGNAPPIVSCTRFRPELPWTCTPPPAVPGTIEELSFHARVQPSTYVLPALLSSVADTTNPKMYLGRLGYVLQGALLAALLVLALRRTMQGPWALGVALLAAVSTPLLAFQIGSLAPNGTETIAVATFAAWLLWLLRAPSRGALVGTAVTAVVALTARDLGPMLVPVAATLVVAASPGGWTRVRSLGGRRVAAAAAAVGAGLVFAVAWRLAFAGPLSPLDLSWSALRRHVAHLPTLLYDSVSLVGWLDVELPRPLVLLWCAGAAAAIVLRAGRDRRSWAVVSLAAAAWIGTNLVLSVTIAATGYGNQARYTLAIPLVLALCLVSRPHVPLLPRRVDGPTAVLVLLVVSLAHCWTLVLNGQRHANGLNDTPLDFSDPVWSPPLGWWWSFAPAFVAVAIAWVAGALVWRRSAASADGAADDPVRDGPSARS